MESGKLEYTTPNGKWVFSAGMGGFLKPNVLHMSRELPSGEHGIQLLHLFEPALISGEQGNRMDRKYIRPLARNSGIEMIVLSEAEWGYEFQLRQQLTEIWMDLFEIARPFMTDVENDQGDRKIKEMLVYIHEHFAESISVEQIANAAHVSKRVCFRLFQENLHMTPVEYMRSYRLRKACQMLSGSREPVTQVAYACGLGSSSYFGKVFREQFGCTPAEYRRKSV